VADPGRQHPGRPGLGAGRPHPGAQRPKAPVVTPPATPTPTPTPLTTFRGWKGEYFANPNLQAPPAVVQDDATINFNWGAARLRPACPQQLLGALVAPGLLRGGQLPHPVNVAGRRAAVSRRPAADRRLAERRPARAGGLTAACWRAATTAWWWSTQAERQRPDRRQLAVCAGPATHGHHQRAQPGRHRPAVDLQRGQLHSGARPADRALRMALRRRQRR
jgi:hypothetical protein